MAFKVVGDEWRDLILNALGALYRYRWKKVLHLEDFLHICSSVVIWYKMVNIYVIFINVQFLSKAFFRDTLLGSQQVSDKFLVLNYLFTTVCNFNDTFSHFVAGLTLLLSVTVSKINLWLKMVTRKRYHSVLFIFVFAPCGFCCMFDHNSNVQYYEHLRDSIMPTSE